MYIIIYNVSLCSHCTGQQVLFCITCITIDTHIIYSLAGNVKSSNSG